MDEAQVELQPRVDFETLRGSNGLKDLLQISNDAMKSSGWFSANNARRSNKFGYEHKPYETVAEFAVRKLQEWAESVDTEVKNAASESNLQTPSDAVGLVQGLIAQGKLDPKFDLLNIFTPSPTTQSILPQDQWHLAKSLFGIDTTELIEARNESLKLPGNESIEDSNGVLIEKIKETGRNVEYLTIEDEERSRWKRIIKADTVIEGVSATLYLNDFLGWRPEGVPQIVDVELEFSPEFLLGIRPVSPGEAALYYAEAKRLYWLGKERDEYRDYSKYEEIPGISIDEDLNLKHYLVLGVSMDATPKQILKAYRAKIKQVHPDHQGASEENKKRAQEINDAFNALYKKPNQKNSEGS